METSIHSNGSKTLIVDTEDIDLYRRLRLWDSCWSCKTSLRGTSLGRDDFYVMAFELQFPTKMKERLERACKTSRSDRSHKGSKIMWEMTGFDPPAWANLHRQIVELFLMDGESKTAQAVFQRLDRSIGKDRIQIALQDISQPYPYWPLEQHIGRDGRVKYSLKPCYQKRSRSAKTVNVI